MIEVIRSVPAVRIDIEDEIDLADDEYGDNANAIYGFAIVEDVEFSRDTDGDMQVTLHTSQGTYTFPSYHLIKKKVDE